MESKPPLRQRPWYAIVWWVLLLISGPWTLFNAYIYYQIGINPGHNMEQGFAVIGWEAFLVISIPIYVVFIVLLFCFPRRRKVNSTSQP